MLYIPSLASNLCFRGGAALKEWNFLKLPSRAAAQRHQEFAHGRHRTCHAVDVSILIIQDTQQWVDVIERGFSKCVIFIEFFWRGVPRSLGDGSWSRFIRHGPWGEIWTLWLRAHVSGDLLAILTSGISFCGRGLKTCHTQVQVEPYLASRGFSRALLLAFTKSFAKLLCRVVGLFHRAWTNDFVNAKSHAREKPLLVG